jgi:hypothetical protein
MIPLLKHEITNNSRIQQILYQKHCIKLSARLRRNTPKYGSDKTHDQRFLTKPMKLTLCRQSKRQNPWNLFGHNGSSAQGQHLCANQITTARHHVDTTKLPLSTETEMVKRFTNIINQAITTSLVRSKKSRGNDDTESELHGSESGEIDTETKKNRDPQTGVC